MRILVSLVILMLSSASLAYGRYERPNLESGNGNVVDLSIQGRNSITGFVFGESRTPVSEVYVELQTDMYATIARTKTNGTGLFRFIGLEAGRYVVNVLTTGTDYQSTSISVSLVPISNMPGRGSVSEQVDFHLKVRPRGAALSSPGVVFGQEVPSEAKSLYEAGVEDLANAKATEGLEKLKRSIEIFPTYYYALDRLGNEYVALGHYQPAIVLLTEAIKVNPRSFSSVFGLGLAEFRSNRVDQSLEQFRNAVKLDKESPNANLWLGIAQHAKGDFQEALESLKKANSLSKGTVAEVHWQLARVYKDLNRFGESASELELFLKYKPDAANAAELRKIIQHLKTKK